MLLKLRQRLEVVEEKMEGRREKMFIANLERHWWADGFQAMHVESAGQHVLKLRRSCWDTTSDQTLR